MTTMNNTKPNDFMEKAAQEFKKVAKSPEWSSFVKTGSHKERPPADNDWWYFRLASMLRTVALKGPIGVSKIRTKYGGRRRRGHKPAKFVKGSGSIARKALQQLETLKFVKQAEVSGHKGRVLTKEGKSFMDSITGKNPVAKEKKSSSKEPEKEQGKDT